MRRKFLGETKVMKLTLINGSHLLLEFLIRSRIYHEILVHNVHTFIDIIKEKEKGLRGLTHTS
jgi:hypothetical protein